MIFMKIIGITGPHGAGKDTLIREIVARFGKTHPGLLSRAVNIYTRKPRADEMLGVDVFIADEQEFMEMVKRGEISYYEHVADYLAGTLVSELKKSQAVIVNITLTGITGNRGIFDPKKDKVLTIYVTAPLKQRRQRILARNPHIPTDQLEFKLAKDPSANLDPKEFDLVVENLDGDFNLTVDTIYSAISEFLNS